MRAQYNRKENGGDVANQENSFCLVACTTNNTMKKLVFMLVVALTGAVIWNMELRRRLQAAQMRGDTYRDISARLDRQLNDDSSAGAAE